MVALLLVLSAGPQIHVEASRVTLENHSFIGGTVCVVQPNIVDEVPVLGEWKGKTFTPRVAFEPGTAYRVTVPGFSGTFTLPKNAAAPGKVTSILPMGDTVPANMLRWYIHFDTPMKQGQGYAHFQLLNAKNQPLPFVFLQLDEELWNDDATRLTLLFDPGRVKRELVPHKDLGPILKDGERYTLVIGKEFRTKDDAPLAAEVKKTFTATAMIDSGMDPAKWTITAPKAGTRQPLTITFDRPMDHALRRRAITLAVPGECGTPDDSTWTWTPKESWKQGTLEIVIDDALEDVCGNRIGVAFDAALGKIGARQRKAATTLSVDVK